MHPLRKIDSFLNGITMYKLLTYILFIILGFGVIFGYTGFISISGNSLLLSIVILTQVCYFADILLGKLFGAVVNPETGVITALILACILQPASSPHRALAVAIAGIIAIASKYILVLHRKHIFNPAAIAAVVVGQLGLLNAIWWIGTPHMAPIVLLLGLLIVRKIREFEMVLVFVVTALIVMVYVNLQHDFGAIDTLKNAFLSWPLLFMGTVMLTEPATSPGVRYWQNFYAILVGLVFACQLKLGPVSSSPQVALIIGNLFTLLVAPGRTYILQLKAKHQLTPQTYDFVFTKPAGFTFKAGQYMQWALPHKKIDKRGNRRNFSIASAPEENEIHLGAKFYEPSSSYKQALQKLEPGDNITISQIRGDFTLPANHKTKLVFIAGGIGITPFRSMVQQMIAGKQKRDIHLLYLITNNKEDAYREVFETAKPLGLKPEYLVNQRLDADLLASKVADYKQRTFYVSGPNAMVSSHKSLLLSLGVPRKQIVTDYFSGY
jgi:ferredoxin-NADP reductase